MIRSPPGVVDLFYDGRNARFWSDQVGRPSGVFEDFRQGNDAEVSHPDRHGGIVRACDEALRFCERLQLPIVIKADGLALGKGVVIAQTSEEAVATIEAMMNEGALARRAVGSWSRNFCAATECSLHAFVGRGGYRMLAAARDHKRAYDGDTGPNTGGMGAVSPAEVWGPDTAAGLSTKSWRRSFCGLTEGGY